jgi:hypothetical protein
MNLIFRCTVLSYPTIVLCALLGACSSSPSASVSDASASADAMTTQMSDAGMDTRPPSGKKPVPADLKSFESNGEGMCEAPVTPDWATAQTLFTQASGTWAKLKVTLAADGASPASIAKIDGLLTQYGADVTKKLSREAETGSNAINATVPDFFDLYDSAVPSDALRLDAAFRFAEIQGEYSDWPTAATALDRTKAAWTNLKPLVTEAAAKRTDVPAGKTVVADVDAAIAAMAAAIAAKNATDLKASAHNGLDLVDVVEQVF